MIKGLTVIKMKFKNDPNWSESTTDAAPGSVLRRFVKMQFLEVVMNTHIHIMCHIYVLASVTVGKKCS